MGCGDREGSKRGVKEGVARGGWAEAARRTPATTPAFSHWGEGVI